jgi:hypothetical protein
MLTFRKAGLLSASLHGVTTAVGCVHKQSVFGRHEVEEVELNMVTASSCCSCGGRIALG